MVGISLGKVRMMPHWAGVLALSLATFGMHGLSSQGGRTMAGILTASIALELAMLILIDKDYHNCSVVIHGDNTGVIGAYNKGRSFNIPCNNLICHITSNVIPNNILIIPMYVASALNRADQISCSIVMSHNICTTNANGFWLVLKLGASRHLSPPTGLVIGPKPDIRFYQTPTLLPLIVIISHLLIPSDPVLTLLVHTLDSSLLHPCYLQLLVF